MLLEDLARPREGKGLLRPQHISPARRVYRSEGKLGLEIEGEELVLEGLSAIQLTDRASGGDCTVFSWAGNTWRTSTPKALWGIEPSNRQLT